MSVSELYKGECARRPVYENSPSVASGGTAGGNPAIVLFYWFADLQSARPAGLCLPYSASRTNAGESLLTTNPVIRVLSRHQIAKASFTVGRLVPHQGGDAR